MSPSTEHPVQLSQAKAGHTYRVYQNACNESMSQKLTLMGLGMGMVIELIAPVSYTHLTLPTIYSV